MNKAKFKFVAFLGFLIILFCCLFFKTELIEKDLFARTNTALIGSGLNVAKATLEGRDVTLEGTVNTEQLKKQAELIAENIWGVRTVNNNLIVEEVKLEPPKPKKEDVLKKILKDLSVANIEFESEKSIIQPQSYHILNDLTDILIKYPDAKIFIDGHTDSTGDPNFNIFLGKNRAKSVKAYLVKKGIKENRLIAQGFGSSKPIATNTTDEGRKLNRRVEFKLLEVK